MFDFSKIPVKHHVTVRPYLQTDKRYLIDGEVFECRGEMSHDSWLLTNVDNRLPLRVERFYKTRNAEGKAIKPYFRLTYGVYRVVSTRTYFNRINT